MARPVDFAKRAELLDAALPILAERGVTLPLRPLAAALGTSDRMLVHYFGSKSRFIGQLLDHTRPDVAALIGPPPHDVRELARGVWRSLSEGGGQEPRVRLFLQISALALTQPDPYAAYVVEATAAWTEPIAEALVGGGVARADADTRATLLVSGMRGLALDRFLTGHRRRTDGAARLLIDACTSLGEPEGAADCRTSRSRSS